MENALNPKFWHVEQKRDLTCPPLSPYYDSNFFDSIMKVKDGGLLIIKTMTAGMWYRWLIEDNITHQLTISGTVQCKIEVKHPQADWERAWSLAITPGVSSKQLTFLWKMVHDLLPSQARLFRLKMPNINSEIYSLLT